MMIPKRFPALLAATLVAALLPANSASAGISLLDFESFPSPPGAVTAETLDLAGALAEVVEQTPGTMTGVRVAGPKSIVLTVPDGADVGAVRRTVQREAARAASGPAAVSVHVQPVARSRADMNRTRAEIERLWFSGEYGRQVVGVGNDPSRGVTVVYATEDSLSARASIKDRFGDAVVFRRMAVPEAVESDRDRDTTPHYGGAGIQLWNHEHTSRRGHCSTAFPVERSGTRYLLTAAHCLPGQTQHPRAWASAFLSATPTPSPSYYFGSMYTTTMSGTYGAASEGNQDLYGDWALLSGSTYSPTVYNCANVTGYCSSLPVGAVSWTNPAVGAVVCTSGRSTGQMCRQYVVEDNCTCLVQYGLDVLYVRYLTLVKSEQDNDGYWDCITVQQGDSGGAVYQGISGRPGYVRALGIVTSSYDEGANCSEHFSAYTQLQGVRAWNSTITMPTL